MGFFNLGHFMLRHFCNLCFIENSEDLFQICKQFLSKEFFVRTFSVRTFYYRTFFVAPPTWLASASAAKKL